MVEVRAAPHLASATRAIWPGRIEMARPGTLRSARLREHDPPPARNGT